MGRWAVCRGCDASAASGLEKGYPGEDTASQEIGLAEDNLSHAAARRVPPDGAQRRRDRPHRALLEPDPALVTGRLRTPPFVAAVSGPPASGGACGAPP